jgi:hypothetical protein
LERTGIPARDRTPESAAGTKGKSGQGARGVANARPGLSPECNPLLGQPVTGLAASHRQRARRATQPSGRLRRPGAQERWGSSVRRGLTLFKVDARRVRARSQTMTRRECDGDRYHQQRRTKAKRCWTRQGWRRPRPPPTRVGLEGRGRMRPRPAKKSQPQAGRARTNRDELLRVFPRPEQLVRGESPAADLVGRAQRGPSSFKCGRACLLHRKGAS